MHYIVRLLTHQTSLFVILSAVIALFAPQLFAWVQQGNTASIILGLIMLTMGMTLSAQDFKILFSRPLDILIGTVAQYTLMPLIAWTLTKVFGLDPFLAVGIILVGCCPGGVSSNIMSYLCHGDVAFSVGMTTVSTLLSPVMTPLLVLWLAGETIEVNALGMFQQILFITLLPVITGALLNYFLGHRPVYARIKSVAPAASVLCLCCIVGGVVYQVHPQLMKNGLQLFLLTMAVVFSHNTLGYLLGYGVGSLCHFSTAKRRTISIEVGMQNAGMATVLANNFFATTAAIAANPLAALSVVPCAISCAYHSISGTVLAGIFAWYDRKKVLFR